MIVIEPVDVAALVSGNDIVNVIDHAWTVMESLCAQRIGSLGALFAAHDRSIRPTISFPLTSAATITGTTTTTTTTTITIT